MILILLLEALPTERIHEFRSFPLLSSGPELRKSI